MSKPNLADGNANDVAAFACSIIFLAESDLRHGGKVRRSGAELVVKFAGSNRVFHANFASTIYNQTRRTLECAGKP